MGKRSKKLHGNSSGSSNNVVQEHSINNGMLTSQEATNDRKLNTARSDYGVKKRHKGTRSLSNKNCRDAHTTPSSDGDHGNVFPKGTELVVFGVTLLVRLTYVSQTRNWWILHADEVYQIVEVARSEVYGYGFRPYEFLQPPSRDPGTSSAQMEARLGMYGLRSFILPKLFMLVFTVAEGLGIRDQPFWIGKLFHASVASCLPLAMYRLAKTLYASHDVGVMAAIFGAASVHLGVFGTHVLVNSFLAPAVFWCVSIALEELISCASPTNSDSGESLGNFQTLNDTSTATLNNNNNNNGKVAIREGGHYGLQNVSNRTEGFSNFLKIKVLLSAVLLGVYTYIRIDLVLFLVFLFSSIILKCVNISWAFVWKSLLLGATFLIGIAIAGLDDWLSYGQWGLSAYQWLRFNIVSGLAESFFGRSVGTKYLTEIILCDWTQCLLAVVVLVNIVYPKAFSSYSKQKIKRKVDISLLFCCITMLAVYSLKPHKETRFLHNAIVVLCILQAKSVLDLVKLSFQNHHPKHEHKKAPVIYAVCFVYVLMSWISFPNSLDGSYSYWTFDGVVGSHDINRCLYYVSNQNDVTGVFNGQSLQNGGGTSILHRNVTFLTLVHREICEFSPESTLRVESVNPFRFGTFDMRVNVANRVTDYITTVNIPYLYTVLFEDKRYNYAIIPAETDFKEIGYIDVFLSGSFKVVKRSVSAKVQKAAHDFVNQLPVWKNATILEFESNWLISLGAAVKAVPRLRQAIRLDASRVRPYQLLTSALHHSGDTEEAGRVQRDCFRKFSKEICLTPQPTVKLKG